jgi:hypothetical protein
VISLPSDEHFGLVGIYQREQEKKRSVIRESRASNVVIPTNHGTPFSCLSIKLNNRIVQL